MKIYKIKTIMKHGLTIFVTFLIIGSSCVYMSTDIYAEEDNKQNDIICNFPDDIIDPGLEIPEYLSAPKVTKIFNKNNAVMVKWNKVKDATGYRIQRKSRNSKWKDLKITNNTQYIDKRVVNGRRYRYKVYAYASGSIDYIESTGTKSITKIHLYLKTPSVNSVKKSNDKKCKISWNKNNKADGYKIQISTSKNFQKALVTKVVSVKNFFTNINDMKKNKTYYVRVRAYKQNEKTIYYSAWSNAKKIK